MLYIIIALGIILIALVIWLIVRSHKGSKTRSSSEADILINAQAEASNLSKSNDNQMCDNSQAPSSTQQDNSVPQSSQEVNQNSQPLAGAGSNAGNSEEVSDTTNNEGKGSDDSTNSFNNQGPSGSTDQN